MLCPSVPVCPAHPYAPGDFWTGPARSGDFWTGPVLPGAIRTLQTFSGVISPYHSAEAADFRPKTQRASECRPKMNRRNTGPTGHRPRTRMKHQNLVSTNQRRWNTVTTSNVSNGVNHRRSRMNTIHRYTVPPKHVKWVINEWNIGFGAISGTAPGQVGNCPLTISGTDPSQTGPVPHQTGDRPPI